MRLADLMARDLDRAYDEWLAEGLAPSSVHRHHATISSALTQAVKWDYLEDSPAAKATPPSSASDRKATVPTVAEVTTLLKQALLTASAGAAQRVVRAAAVAQESSGLSTEAAREEEPIGFCLATPARGSSSAVTASTSAS